MPDAGEVDGVPFMAFGNEELEGLPVAKIGEIRKMACGHEHEIKGSNELGWYRCGSNQYLAALDGRFVEGVGTTKTTPSDDARIRLKAMPGEPTKEQLIAELWRRLEANLRVSWWWRPDDEPHVIKLCWPHGVAALEHGWRPGAADLWDQVDADADVHDVCIVCDRGFDLQAGRSP